MLLNSFSLEAKQGGKPWQKSLWEKTVKLEMESELQAEGTKINAQQQQTWWTLKVNAAGNMEHGRKFNVEDL